MSLICMVHSAADIKDLRIIEERSERAKTHSTVAVPAGRKSRTTVCETLQANPTNTGQWVPTSTSHIHHPSLIHLAFI